MFTCLYRCDITILPQIVFCLLYVAIFMMKGRSLMITYNLTFVGRWPGSAWVLKTFFNHDEFSPAVTSVQEVLPLKYVCRFPRGANSWHPTLWTALCFFSSGSFLSFSMSSTFIFALKEGHVCIGDNLSKGKLTSESFSCEFLIILSICKEIVYLFMIFRLQETLKPIHY